MKEAEQRFTRLWFTPQVRKAFMDSCGYSAANSNNEGKKVFTRRLIERRPFPRFHLIVEEEGVDYKFDLYFNVRPHLADHFGSDVPIELERINKRLGEIDRLRLTEPGIDNLKREFVALSMYGAYESITRPLYSFNHDFSFGNKKDIRRKHRSPRPNLKLVPDDFDEY